MEGLLAILIAAISLAIFLQKNTPSIESKSNFMDWDSWARDRDWSFFPPSGDAPMAIIGMQNEYNTYIYAKKFQNNAYFKFYKNLCILGNFLLSNVLIFNIILYF